MTPRVSIVINNFNYARFLTQCIDSALAQTRLQTQVVVVDDFSTDKSRDIIRSYGDRLVAVLPERNGGQAAAMNAGFAACQGDLIMFLDADDYLYPQAADRVATAVAPGDGIIQYRLHLVDVDGRCIDLHPAPEIAFDSGDVLPKVLTTGGYRGTVTSGNAFTRSALTAIMPIPEDRFRISADGYLVTSAPFHGKVSSIEEPLGAYRLHGANHWASGPSLAKRCRKSLLHDVDKYQVLHECAARAGLEAAEQPGMGDLNHLQMRLGSLCLEPGEHPYAGDRRWMLALRGAREVLHERLALRRRLLLAAWFAAIGLLPRPLATRLLAWRLDPASRPEGLRNVFRKVRIATR